MLHLHNAHIVHRDLSHNNVMYDPVTHRAVVIDFGLARRANDRSKLLHVLGTIGAGTFPTWVEDEPATDASDIYAFGVIAADFLTGGVFNRTKFEAIAARIVGLPAGLIPLLMRCTDSDPRSRPLAVELVPLLRELAP